MSAVGRLVVFIVAWTLAACSAATTPTPTPTPRHTPTLTPTAPPTPVPSPTIFEPVEVELIGDTPALRPTDLGDYGSVLAATYFVDGGTHHAYVVGFADTRGIQRVFHVTSADGIAWEIDEEDPFTEIGLDLSPPGPIPGTVMRHEEGWVMYLWGVRAPFPSGAVLWRATSDGPGGPWRADQTPILEIGERGEWDDLGLDFPAVVETEGGFLMLYGANGTTHRDAALIGYARSDDGRTWERGSGPSLDPETCGTAENDFIAQPRLLPTDDGGYLALFLAGADMAAATSPDGVTWTCLGDGPVLLGSDLSTGDRVHSFAAAIDAGGIRLLIESLVDRGSELWLGEMPLP